MCFSFQLWNCFKNCAFVLGDLFMHCSLCRVNFGISHAGRNDVTSYLKSKKHSNLAKSVSIKATLFHHQSSITDISIEAEVRWATFIAKHNIAFLASDHATSPFSKIFPDYKITEKFACARTKALL